MQSNKNHASIQLALSMMKRYSDRNRPGEITQRFYADRHGFPLLSSTLMLMDVSGFAVTWSPLVRENRKDLKVKLFHWLKFLVRGENYSL